MSKTTITISEELCEILNQEIDRIGLGVFELVEYVTDNNLFPECYNIQSNQVKKWASGEASRTQGHVFYAFLHACSLVGVIKEKPKPKFVKITPEIRKELQICGPKYSLLLNEDCPESLTRSVISNIRRKVMKSIQYEHLEYIRKYKPATAQCQIGAPAMLQKAAHP